ncbi:MAG: DUF3575 domain-containing protein [Kofleriaceae bacterium]|nr:DUF3575 domain-containing protein [Kofleriaceae bacterium]
MSRPTTCRDVARAVKSAAAMPTHVHPTILLSSLTLAVVASSLAASPATADGADPRVAVTVSPLHLFVPMAEVTVEARVAPRLGVAVIGGVGAVRDAATDERIRLFEGGASARYYVLGSFRHGLQLGAEALYVHADATADATGVQAAGLGLSPFVGYKWTHRTGVTIDAQLGATYLAARAEADTGATADTRDVAPMLNLNLGYSF